MARIDYYSFDVFEPYKFNDESYKTLRSAKIAYRKHLAKGHRVSNMIYGRTRKDECIMLSYTPYWRDAQCFAQTRLTNIGKQLKHKECGKED